MRRLSRLRHSSAWRRALGELVLIVVGVLVALWVNDVNQAGLDRVRERDDLQALLRTTRENEQRIGLALDRDSASLLGPGRLLAALEPGWGGPPASPDSLAAWQDAAFRFAPRSPLTGTYTALARSGDLNLLRNGVLRAALEAELHVPVRSPAPGPSRSPGSGLYASTAGVDGGGTDPGAGRPPASA